MAYQKDEAKEDKGRPDKAVQYLLDQGDDLSLAALVDYIYEEIYGRPYHLVDQKWLKLMKTAVTRRVQGRMKKGKYSAEEALEWIGWIDKMIIMTGCTDALVYGLIAKLQSHCASPQLRKVSRPAKRARSLDLPIEHEILSLDPAPDLEDFLKIDYPFIIRDYAKNFKGVSQTPWSDLDYLLKVAGPGRLVPVEIGERYTDEDWGQKIIPFETFLEALGANDKRPIYLGQYNLLSQMPDLKRDIQVPDYCIVERKAPSNFPSYKPPVGTAEDSNLLINAWCGPKGVVSPLHHDPYYNCYIMMAGEKYVWLAPPELGSELQPFGKDGQDDINALLTNTSRLDPLVIMTDPAQHDKVPNYRSRIAPMAQQAILRKGDMLFMPPGWWHYFRGAGTGPTFGLSFWF